MAASIKSDIDGGSSIGHDSGCPTTDFHTTDPSGDDISDDERKAFTSSWKKKVYDKHIV